MENSNKTSHWGVSAVMLAVGLLVGMGVGMAMKHGQVNDLKQQVNSARANSASTKGADLRATLVGLGVEHMALTDQAIADTLDGSPAATATAGSLYKNGTSIGAAVGSVYGQEAEATFNSVWKLHLDRFVDYAVAGSKGDTNAQKDALDHHVQETAKVIDLHIQKNYEEEAKQLVHANEHMVEIFSSLSGAIVKQYPDKF